MGATARSHCVFVSLPQCFEIAPSVFLEWNIETKNETSGYYVSWFESIDYQHFQTLKWNMKAKNVDGKIYVSESLFRAFWNVL